MPDSRALALAESFRPLGREGALRVARAAWRQLPIEERVALITDWSFWARPKQLPPPGEWKSWGFLTGRGFGKTEAVSSFINGEIDAGRLRSIGMAAQNEAKSIEVQVYGDTGLIATSKPNNRPQFRASELVLVWPNGARAHVLTPEVPGAIRGPQYQLFWMTELQSWPRATMQEAYDNVFLSTRISGARIVWDCTPKRRHPLLKDLLAANEADPARHCVVRGTTHENKVNLATSYVADMERKFGGTMRGREELLGEMLDDSENALVKQSWIDGSRRSKPGRFVRRVIGVDPAVSDRKGSDTTGIVDAGLGDDGQAYVLGDASGKHAPEAWGTKVLDWYVDHDADLVLAETNKGGQLVAQNLRALAKARGLEVIVIGKDERAPPRTVGKVFVREVYARGAKEDRAEPVATAYERRRVSHAQGVDLASLEDTLTTWEPAPNADSPGDLDALVHAMVELLDLANNMPDLSKGFVGLEAVNKELRTPSGKSPVVSYAFGASIRGNRI
jgi:phage terminase large subunit-like protein